MTPLQRALAQRRVRQALLGSAGDGPSAAEVGCQTGEDVLPLSALPEAALRAVLARLTLIDLLQVQSVDRGLRGLVQSVFQSQLVHSDMAYVRRVAVVKGRKAICEVDILKGAGGKIRRLVANDRDLAVIANSDCCSELVELRKCYDNIYVNFCANPLRCENLLKLDHLAVLDGFVMIDETDVEQLETVLNRLRIVKLRVLKLVPSILALLLNGENRGAIEGVEELVVATSKDVNSSKLFDLFPLCNGFHVRNNTGNLEFLEFLPLSLRKLTIWNCSVAFQPGDLHHLSGLRNVTEFDFSENGPCSCFPDYRFLASFACLKKFFMNSRCFSERDFVHIPACAPLREVYVTNNKSTEEGLAIPGFRTILQQLLDRKCGLVGVALSEVSDPESVCELLSQCQDTLKFVDLQVSDVCDSAFECMSGKLIARLIGFSLSSKQKQPFSLAALVDFIERRARLYLDLTVEFPPRDFELRIQKCSWDEEVRQYLQRLAEGAGMGINYV